MKREQSAAVVTVRNANAMTTNGRRQIASWLRKQAAFLEQHGREFSGRFTARYLYR